MNNCTETDVARLLGLVPAFRKEKALRYSHLFGQWTTLKSWELLMQLVPCPTLSIRYGQYDKPYLTEGPFFSISHCRTAVAVAVDDECEVGIDIESIRHADEALIQRTMNEQEQELICQAQEPDRMFTTFWTQKEAVLKARGTGLVDELPLVLSSLSDEEKKRLQTFVFENYIFSVFVC